MKPGKRKQPFAGNRFFGGRLVFLNDDWAYSLVLIYSPAINLFFPISRAGSLSAIFPPAPISMHIKLTKPSFDELGSQP